MYGRLSTDNIDLDSDTNADAPEEIPSDYFISGKSVNPSPFFREKRIGDSCEVQYYLEN